MKVIEGQLTGTGRKVAIVAARFNDFLVGHLIEGATNTLVRHGVATEDMTLVRVPGSYELPLVAKALAQTGSVDGVVALGVVIRGATNHFDIVCNEAAKGISAVSLETLVPCTFGVVSTDTIEQAIERCGTKAGNKGADAACALLEMISVMDQLP